MVVEYSSVVIPEVFLNCQEKVTEFIKDYLINVDIVTKFNYIKEIYNLEFTINFGAFISVTYSFEHGPAHSFKGFERIEIPIYLNEVRSNEITTGDEHCVRRLSKEQVRLSNSGIQDITASNGSGHNKRKRGVTSGIGTATKKRKNDTKM